MRDARSSQARVLGRCLAAALVLGGCAPGPQREAVPAGEPQVAGVAEELDLAGFFEGIDPRDATFVLLDGATGALARYNPDRAAERFLPASTFKIPNSLIALETGVASGAEFTIAYDSARVRTPGFWIADWSRDHTLRSAFRGSVVWYYRELARRIGEERMREYLDRFEYGNRSIEGGLDRFWLQGGLRVSPDEQVRFLQRLYAGELGVSARSAEILKEIMLLEETPEYRLSGKTGTADLTPTRELAWLVGTVEREGNVWFYALNMEGEEVWERWGPPLVRRQLVIDILRSVGVLPRQGEPDRVRERPAR
jgi:beta-lactamase class D